MMTVGLHEEMHFHSLCLLEDFETRGHKVAVRVEAGSSDWRRISKTQDDSATATRGFFGVQDGSATATRGSSPAPLGTLNPGSPTVRHVETLLHHVTQNLHVADRWKAWISDLGKCEKWLVDRREEWWRICTAPASQPV